MHRHLRSTGLSELASDTLSETLPIRLFCHFLPTIQKKFVSLLIDYPNSTFMAEDYIFDPKEDDDDALKYTLVSNVSLLTSISPLLTTLLTGFFYKQEKPQVGVYIGSVVALIGVTLVVFNGGMSMQIMPLGDLIAFSAAVSWAFYSIIIRKLNVVYDALFITRKTFFYGIVTAIPFLAFEPRICNPAVLIQSYVLF